MKIKTITIMSGRMLYDFGKPTAQLGNEIMLTAELRPGESVTAAAIALDQRIDECLKALNEIDPANSNRAKAA